MLCWCISSNIFNVYSNSKFINKKKKSFFFFFKFLVSNFIDLFATRPNAANDQSRRGIHATNTFTPPIQQFDYSSYYYYYYCYNNLELLFILLFVNYYRCYCCCCCGGFNIASAVVVVLFFNNNNEK